MDTYANKNSDSYNQPTEIASKSHSKMYSRFYDGFFNDGRGNPDIRYYGYILEVAIPLFGLYLLITKKYKYASYFIALLAVGSILNGICFYYVNPLYSGGADDKFLSYAVYHNVFDAVLAIFCLILLFIQKI